MNRPTGVNANSAANSSSHVDHPHDQKSAILAILVDRLGGRVTITADEFAEAMGRCARLVKSGNDTVLESWQQ